MRRTLGAAAVVALALLAGCGTTVPSASQDAQSAGTADGLGGDAAPTTAATTTATDPSGAGGQPIVSVPGSSTASVTAPSGTGASGTGPATPDAGTQVPTTVTAPVAKKAPIEVGIPYLDAGQTNTLTAGIGSGLASADTRTLYEAYLAKVNAAGGILGHKVVGAYYKVDPNTPTTQLDQQVCTYFTQDHKVRFVFAQQVSTILFSCLTKAGVADIADGIGDEVSSRELAADSLLLMPQTVTLDRLARLAVPRLVANGYLGKGAKLGVLYYENVAASVDGLNALKASLAAQHLSLGDAVGITKASGAGDLGAMEAAVQSAELKFKAEGINRVMCEEGTPFLCGFFPIYANSQGYYPRYAFSSAETLQAIVDNNSARSLRDAVAITWFPASDLQEQAKMPARTQACLKLFQDKGIQMSTGNQKDQGVTVCEDVAFLRAALEKAPELSARGLIAGARLVGSAYSAIGTFGVSFPGAQRDGAALISEAGFTSSCSCFRYTKAPARG